jgi:hypothetical protein
MVRCVPYVSTITFFFGQEKEEPPKRKTARLIPFSQLALWIKFFKLKPTYQGIGTFNIGI